MLTKFFFSDVDDLGDEVGNSNNYLINSVTEGVTLSEIHFAELQRTIQSLKAQLEQRDLACLLAKQVCYFIKVY